MHTKTPKEKYPIKYAMLC